ncbi:hypothetical protein C0J52_16686 [Blattella germanica]|nr:hypothetical protein C0J52_16686 [Blattella germanica]
MLFTDDPNNSKEFSPCELNFWEHVIQVYREMRQFRDLNIYDRKPGSDHKKKPLMSDDCFIVMQILRNRDIWAAETLIHLENMVFREGDKFSENVKIKFRKHFPNAICPNRDTVRDLIRKFRETGSVHDVPRSGRPKLLTEAKVDEISDVMLRSPTKSMRKSTVYKNNPKSIDELEGEITNYVNSITRETLQKVFQN